MKIEDAIKEMEEKIKDIGKAPVLFIGSGLSRRYYDTPDWQKLLEIIAKKVDISVEEMNKWGSNECKATELEYHCFANQKPDYSKQENRRYPLRKIIKEIFDEKNTVLEKMKEEIDELASIIPTAIVTTNYDNLLKDKIWKGYDVCIGQDIIYKNRDRYSKTIYKIHGCISDVSSIVITQEDYDRFMSKSKYLYSKLMTLFCENPIIFMGYSISDANVKNVLDTILDIMTDEQKKDFEQRVWRLVHKKGKDEYFENSDIPVGMNKFKIKSFYLDESYKKIYKSLKVITNSIEEKNLQFDISENAINLLIEPLYKEQDRFKVVVRELLQNAIDACKKGDRRIKVEVKVEKVNDSTLLKVTDHGIGMDINDIKDFFLTIGSSNKNADNGLTGKFGIGVLSIFLVAKEAKVYSKKNASIPIGIRIFEDGDKKSVDKIYINNELDDIVTGTIIEVKLNDGETIKSIEGKDEIEDIIRILGLNNYCVWDNAKIDIEYNGETHTILRINDENMKKISENLIIEKVYEEQKYSKGTALINDMVVSVRFKRCNEDMIANKEIPFFAVKTDKNLYHEDIEPKLSRDNVEIGGKLRDDIIKSIYEEEADKLIEIVNTQIKNNKITLRDFYENVHSELKILCSQNIAYGKNSIIIPEKYGIVMQVYDYGFDRNVLEGWKIFEDLVENENCNYVKGKIRGFDFKYDLANMIEGDEIIGIGVSYLNKYICNATSSSTGLRQNAIKKLFQRLNIIKYVEYNTAAEMWTNIMNQSKNIAKEFENKSEYGIVWLDDKYKKKVNTQETSFNQCIIAKKYKNCIDSEFITILKDKLKDNKGIENYIKFETHEIKRKGLF